MEINTIFFSHLSDLNIIKNGTKELNKIKKNWKRRKLKKKFIFLLQRTVYTRQRNKGKKTVNLSCSCYNDTIVKKK